MYMNTFISTTMNKTDSIRKMKSVCYLKFNPCYHNGSFCTVRTKCGSSKFDTCCFDSIIIDLPPENIEDYISRVCKYISVVNYIFLYLSSSTRIL